MLRLLILSDIHLMSLISEMDPNYKFRKEFIKDVRGYREACGSIDHILVSGDIANKGNAQEYTLAFSFFKEICAVSGCPEEQVYVVPGNHDKNFTADNAPIRHIINAGLSNENIDADSLYCELLQQDFENFKKLFQPFKDYNEFAMKLDSQEPLMTKCLDEMSTDSYSADRDKAFLKRKINTIGEYDVFLFAMNTSFVSDWYDINDDEEGHKLFLPRLSYNAEVDKENCINIAMMHHPTNRLVNSAEIEKVLDDSYQIQIFGHLHKAASNTNKCFHINSGAMQPQVAEEDEEDSYFSVFNILEIDVESIDGGDYLKAKLRVQKYNKETNKFEELDNESKSFKTLLVKHQNRWVEGERPAEKLPEGVTARKIRYSFLQLDNQKNLINKLSTYDATRSFSENCVLFLNKMETEHRLGELWNEINGL